jgi:tetratricopeptide (TPR) repeat protein
MIAENEILPATEDLRSERPAAEHLGALGATDEWERRAEWLETEAKAQREPAARARLLLAASEVRALLGARTEARRLAIQAAGHQPALPFAARQARALHQMQGDVGALARSLTDEAGSAQSPLLAAHAHYLAAEVQRLLQRDPLAARASLEAAEAADPSDIRAPLQRLVLELSRGQEPPSVAFSDDPDSEPLRRAVAVIRGLRGGPAPAPGPGQEDALCLVEVQRALAQGQLEAAADALAPLGARPGLAPAVRWLRTLFHAASARPAALEAHRELARQAPGSAARRALAARAVAANDWTALQEALGDPPASAADADRAPGSEPTGAHARPVFSAVERAALAALVGQRPLPSTPQEAHDASTLGSIAAAVERASSAPPRAVVLAPESAEEAEFALGRALGVGLSAEVDALASAQPWSQVVRLEQSRVRADWSSMARDLPRLFDAPVAVAEGSFVAAVFAEKAGDRGAARELFQASLPSASTREAATRALTEKPGDGAAPLRALSAHTSDPLRRALLLSEALFRLDPAAPEFDALAEEAARTYHELPFAVELGELGARARGDRVRAARWLARRREHAQGADDHDFATLREVISSLDLDRAAGERLAELVARRPGDLGLALASERLLEPGARARADLRKRLAAGSSPRGRLRFLAEAVGLYEAENERSLAFGLAREVGGTLGELWAARLASTDAELDAIANEWLRAAQRTGDSALAADLYVHLAELERRRGRPALALAWQRERLAIEPGSIEALRALHVDNMLAGRETELEQTATALFEALGERDGLGHAYVATRLKIARGAFDEARPLVRRVHASATPPLWALRLDAVYARGACDDRTLLAACRSLRERSSQALDAATLSLHAAEAALRLGETQLARDDIQRAGELAPDDIVILSVRAEVLLENGDHAEAAEAFETLASATSSKARQVDALYQAALLWLDALHNRARGMLALQEAASLDVPHAGLLERLVALHAQSDDLDGLAELIERQRAIVPRSTSGADIDLSRALDYADGGRLGEARTQLNALLERRPRDPAVLAASAELHVRAGEIGLAESEWRRLGELGDDPAQRASLLGLISIYEREPAGSEQLGSLYEQLLALDPEETTIRSRLVALLASREAWADACAHQRALLARATDETERKARSLYLVELLDRVPEGASEAESLLEQARRTWPDDPRVLEAEVAHYEALGHPGTARVIVERALSAARAAIASGRIEAASFRALEVAARLSNDSEAARAASAMAIAIAGGPRTELPGAGALAGDGELDELTAPEPLSLELRRLLYVAGAAIERAYASDPHSANASAAPHPIANRVRELALGFGLEHVRVLIAPDLGCDCLCLGAWPVSVVLGRALLDADPAVQTFLVLRALAIAKVNGCALSRMAPDEGWVILAGFFACFGPAWPVSAPEAQRVLVARNKIRPHLTWVPEPNLSDRVTELMDEVLPRAGQIAEALCRWGTRIALLGVGDPTVALDGLIESDPRGGRPSSEEARMRWIAGHAEANDLVSYGVSEAYIAARQRAGLAAVSGQRHPGGGGAVGAP